jgi:nicotinate-nucleotide adenylyltransferase
VPVVERLGVFGGTFDPIHVAHIVAAVEARRVLALDRVLLVPAGDPWQKRGQVSAGAADRLAMVEAAVEGIEGLEACAIEVERPGPSYTAHTIEALAGPNRQLFLIIGTDVAAELDTWHDLERIPPLATLVIVDREGVTGEGEVPGGAWRIERVSIPRLDLSSTELRARVARGWPLDGMVPPGAVRVIRERNLYRRRVGKGLLRSGDRSRHRRAGGIGTTTSVRLNGADGTGKVKLRGSERPG